jgi:putative glycerol-1-phosphate prenyltransferase
MSKLTQSEINNLLTSVKRKKISVLIDPDKHNDSSLNRTITQSEKAGVDFFLIGGSLLHRPIDEIITKIKNQSSIPLILFPGNLLQLTSAVDAMLLLSLISGRNPEFLIGNHVIAAPIIKKFQIPCISTGYILVGTGKTTSVEYMSSTTPIPYHKHEIAMATAMAGELLGMKIIYLDAGSGAEKPISDTMIREVKKSIKIPLIIGGGIKNESQLENVCKSGADIVVIGNAFEKKTSLIQSFASIVHQF